jgi:ABC-type phosphate transport system substrate-binding protein
MKKIGVLLWIFFTWAIGFGFPDVLIITNPGIPVSSLKKKEIQDIFTGKKTRWNGNGKIIIATLKDSEVHEEFLREFVNKTPSQFRNFWRRKVFSGEGRMPKTFADEASLIDFVTHTKGAVGYISSATAKPVKIIKNSDNEGGR